MEHKVRIIEIKNKDKEEFEEIIKIFSNTNIKELNIVLFK